MNIDILKETLTQNGRQIKSEKRAGNNLGTVVKLTNGCIINCFDSGTLSFQGTVDQEIKSILEGGTPIASNKKVFVVYGHDHDVRTQLEAMLRRWDLDPIIIDQLPSSGQTIIEKLEEHTGQANFGIVLATPDDIGYAKDDETNKKYRVRQNVVLELGMLLASIGRSRVAILLSQKEALERPSDIDGLIYIPFKDNVEESKNSLAREMVKFGYRVDVSKL